MTEYFVKKYKNTLNKEEVKKELLINDLDFFRFFKNAKKIPIRKVISVFSQLDDLITKGYIK